jgi:hypothetical protein
MTYRSTMIGGRLEISRNSEHGTTVACIFPMK